MSNQKVIGVDIGNSFVKSAEFYRTEIGEISQWSSLDDLITVHPNDHFVITSVGEQDVSRKFPDSFILSPKTPIPLKIDYKTPETLGMDRVAAAVGAWDMFPKTNLLVIDGGSCITYDLISKEGVYLGGIISPGLEMRLKAMNHFTQSLPLVKPADISPPGKSTEECLQIGAVQGLKHEIEGFLASFNKKLEDLQVVTTGGSVPSFDSTIKKPIFASSKIVLGGLHAIWRFNEGT